MYHVCIRRFNVDRTNKENHKQRKVSKAEGKVEEVGFDIDRLLHAKMDRNYKKYNPVTNGELREQGMNGEEAMAHQKQEWDSDSEAWEL